MIWRMLGFLAVWKRESDTGYLVRRLMLLKPAGDISTCFGFNSVYYYFKTLYVVKELWFTSDLFLFIFDGPVCAFYVVVGKTLKELNA
jgi:hypothetical protein